MPMTSQVFPSLPARKLRQPLLQLLTVVVGGGFLDLHLDLGDTRLNIGLLACTAHEKSTAIKSADAGVGDLPVSRVHRGGRPDAIGCFVKATARNQ